MEISFQGKYPHLRGTHLKTCTSLKYIFDILVPVLISTFDHLALYDYGHDLLVDEIQVRETDNMFIQSE